MDSRAQGETDVSDEAEEGKVWANEVGLVVGM